MLSDRDDHAVSPPRRSPRFESKAPSHDDVVDALAGLMRLVKARRVLQIIEVEYNKIGNESRFDSPAVFEPNAKCGSACAPTNSVRQVACTVP